MLPLRKLGRSIPSFIYMGCSRRDLGTPPRIQVSRCDPNVRNVHKGNNGIKLFLARMRFWRGTAASTTFWQFVPASPRELSGPPRRAPGQGAQFRHSVSLQLAERIAVKAERKCYAGAAAMASISIRKPGLGRAATTRSIEAGRHPPRNLARMAP